MRRPGMSAVLQVGLGFLLALTWALAHGGQEPAVATSNPSDASQRSSAIVNQQPHRYGAGTTVRIIRNEPSPIILSAQGDLPKRPGIQSTNGAIAVVYPDLGDPYRSIFKTIIEGIEEQASVSVRSYPIGPNVDAANLNAQLKRNGTKVVIALGRQGLKAVSGLERDIAVVVGGVLSVPEAENRNLVGISLTPDPSVLFFHLKSLLPGTKRVIVIYDPQHNAWLLTLAQAAANAQGLELVAQEARDMASAARLYKAAFATADKHRDVIWLPQDATTVDEDTILPLVLQEAWSHDVPVFSSSFLHVKKGALFALYPNNLELGRTLAHTALDILAGESPQQGMLPLRAVFTAINLRTASHLGLNIGYQQQHRFDFVFPEP